MSTHADVVPAATRPQQRWLGLAGWALLVAALVAYLFIPFTYRALQTVGSTDGRTLDAAGYEERRGGSPVDAPAIRRGDVLFHALMDAQQAAAINKNASDRHGHALLLGLPGAFLLGYSRRSARR